jgi:NAD(P)-dependent dehydrogenase (short-subunit alcohol dehydrogenase family)
MSSIHGCAGFIDHSIYDGTKGAIIATTRELAVELAPLGIRVNGIAPGWIVVESHYKQIRNFDPDGIGQRMVPWRRLGKPIEVARACVYLASEDADYYGRAHPGAGRRGDGQGLVAVGHIGF